MSLENKTPADSLNDLMYIDNSNTGLDSNLRQLFSGSGTASSVQISDRNLLVKSNTNNTTAFIVKNASDGEKFKVDTTNNQVKALGTHVNTMYATFAVESAESSNYAANTHYAMPFGGNTNPNTVQAPDIGTGTEPNTTFTTAEANSQRASQLVTCLWYVPDAISIDAVYSMEGADTATGDTTRMHLVSYAFTSGSTSALTSGTLLASNSDVTNAGSEQIYLSNWTVNSSAVAAGRVIVATFRQDSTNSDYSASVTVKYHLT
jgi:hypothetical protein